MNLVLRLDGDECTTLAEVSRDVEDPETRDATAALIAAAPELYEALEELVKANEEWNKAVAAIVTTPPSWADTYLDAARSALAKARGET
jgi:hypothetical protein